MDGWRISSSSWTLRAAARRARMRRSTSASATAGLDRAQLGDLIARRAVCSAAEHVAAAITAAEASSEISPN